MSTTLNIRWAGQADEAAIARLAALDSQRRPEGELLVAEAGGELVAALPVSGGTPVADPFHRTAAVVDLLALRARQVGAADRASRARRGAQRARPIAVR
jgi:hypothetical protein